MSFLNLPWQWDDAVTVRVPVDMVVKRWRRGPVTFYRYTLLLPTGDAEVYYFFCWADDWSICFSIHTPPRKKS